MLRRLLRWLPALVWMGVIFYWSSQSELPIDGQPESAWLHIQAHVVAYAILALWLTLGAGTSRRGLVTAFLLATLYGMSDEIHQSLVPGREGRVQEVVLDAAFSTGALVVFGVLRSLAVTARASTLYRRMSPGPGDP